MNICKTSSFLSVIYGRPLKNRETTKLTAALPTFLTTHANMAVLPLMTVTLVGVDGSMKGRIVVDGSDGSISVYM